jgi:hypothetical protein
MFDERHVYPSLLTMMLDANAKLVLGCQDVKLLTELKSVTIVTSLPMPPPS